MDVVAQFRMRMQITAPSGDLCVQIGDAIEDGHDFGLVELASRQAFIVANGGDGGDARQGRPTMQQRCPIDWAFSTPTSRNRDRRRCLAAA
jgi:hypothetical protein